MDIDHNIFLLFHFLTHRARLLRVLEHSWKAKFHSSRKPMFGLSFGGGIFISENKYSLKILPPKLMETKELFQEYFFKFAAKTKMPHLVPINSTPHTDSYPNNPTPTAPTPCPFLFQNSNQTSPLGVICIFRL